MDGWVGMSLCVCVCPIIIPKTIFYSALAKMLSIAI